MSAQVRPAFSQRLGHALLRRDNDWLCTQGINAAIRRSLAVIEFNLDGVVLDANQVFLDAMGYRLEEVVGKHHRQFLHLEDSSSADYQAFWKKLAAGQFVSGQFRRADKQGRDVWLQASYNPILAGENKPCRIIKFASVITEQREHQAELESELAAIDKSMGVIEFDLQGNILHANANFLNAMGYTAEELRGKHHRLFVSAELANSAEYRTFWEKLGRGEIDAGQYRRLGKGGREVWIEASYNPVFDAAGRPYKVIKFATDITAQKQRDADSRSQLEAINRSMAVIEFDLNGNVLHANENFLNVMRYRLDEIVGKHHRQFVLPEEANSDAYKAFWENLAQGRPESGRYRRVAKDRSEVWLQASYNPVFDCNGKPYKVVKFAADITPALRSMMGEIGELAEAIKLASGEIATGNADLAVRTESQAASIEETAASMEELISTVRQNAHHAEEATKFAADASHAAERGSQVVRSVVDSMRDIDGASRRISDIIGLIDGIAFQTNILALNAAVEAARAGEQGRGFAVVASEVRALAQRSAEAARDIKGLIKDSAGSVAQGTERAEAAGEAVQSILTGIKKVGELLNDVAAASSEQARGIEQVNIAINEMDQGTQQNAALVEQASAAARTLDEQAAGLNQAVAHYMGGQP